MEFLENFWATYGGTIITGAGWLVTAVIVPVLCKGVFSRSLKGFKPNRIELSLEQKKSLADEVSKRIAGGVIDIDISETVTSAVKDEFSDIAKKLAALERSIETANESTALMAKGISRSKLLSDDERDKLGKNADSLSEKLGMTKRNHVTLKIESKEEKPNDNSLASF